jgi:hypothetical protein
VLTRVVSLTVTKPEPDSEVEIEQDVDALRYRERADRDAAIAEELVQAERIADGLSGERRSD